jgi:hypothetical protein
VVGAIGAIGAVVVGVGGTVCAVCVVSFGAACKVCSVRDVRAVCAVSAGRARNAVLHFAKAHGTTVQLFDLNSLLVGGNGRSQKGNRLPTARRQAGITDAHCGT